MTFTKDPQEIKKGNWCLRCGQIEKNSICGVYGKTYKKHMKPSKEGQG